MKLELRLLPDDAARLPRLPMLSAAGRLRRQTVRIVWHDSPDGALAAGGLALAQERGAWRLERLLPAGDVWPPGGPPPILAQADSLHRLDAAMPPAVAAVAAFAGRRTGYAVETGHGPVTLWLLRGALRAVEHEHTACRLHLEGADPAVRATALALVEHLAVAVPRGTLAAEALGLARGMLPERSHGAAVVPQGLGIADSFACAIGQLADTLLHFAPAAAADTEGPEPVHQMRVAVRRLRSTVSIFRRALGCAELAAASEDLKGLGMRLGPTRDWDVFLGETAPAVTAVFPDEHRLARLLRAAERQRRACHAALRDYLQGPAFRRLGIELAWLAGARSWHPPLPDDAAPVSLPDFAAAVLHKRWRSLLDATDDVAALDAAGLHALRLRAKRARYAAEIFAMLYAPKPARRFIERLADLQERLGVSNDGATAAALLAQLGPKQAFATGLVQGFVGAGAARLRPKIVKAWDRLRRTPRFWD